MGRWHSDGRLRAALGRSLPVPCPYCHELVHPHQPWDIDHVVPRAYGGTVADGVRPAHRACNIRAGHAVLAGRARAQTHGREW